jgi:hypothetical protein
MENKKENEHLLDAENHRVSCHVIYLPLSPHTKPPTKAGGDPQSIPCVCTTSMCVRREPRCTILSAEDGWKICSRLTTSTSGIVYALKRHFGGLCTASNFLVLLLNYSCKGFEEREKVNYEEFFPFTAHWLPRWVISIVNLRSPTLHQTPHHKFCQCLTRN